MLIAAIVNEAGRPHRKCYRRASATLQPKISLAAIETFRDTVGAFCVRYVIAMPSGCRRQQGADLIESASGWK